jgi:hypothetical protein
MISEATIQRCTNVLSQHGIIPPKHVLRLIIDNDPEFVQILATRYPVELSDRNEMLQNDDAYVLLDAIAEYYSDITDCWPMSVNGPMIAQMFREELFHAIERDGWTIRPPVLH